MIADLEQIEKNLPTLAKIGAKRSKEQEALFAIYTLAKESLDNGKFVYEIRPQLTPEELKALKSLSFLTDKHMIYAVNVAESDLDKFKDIEKEIKDKLNRNAVVVCAKIESEFIPLSEEEKHEYQEALFGDVTDYASVPTLDRLIKTAFDEVGLMYYFTA